MTRTQSLHCIIDADCNSKEAYNFNANNEMRVGYLQKLSFPSVNIELEPDEYVIDPENPQNRFKTVGIIERIRWTGSSDEPVEITARLSPANTALLREALTSLTDRADLEAEWVVYDFDHKAKKYYKRFHTDNKTIKAVIPDDMRVYVSENPCNYVTKPANCLFELYLVPDTRFVGQQLSFAYRTEKQFKRKFERVTQANLTEAGK
jgi:hypothetical protein